MFEKIYELPISKDYVRHWGMNEGVREIIQNALDSESPFEWEFKDDVLSIRSRHAALKPSTLLLGVTSKENNKDAIGSFGEGYKIAMLVLVRCGYNVRIYNNDVIWSPEFRLNKKFGAETLHVIETAAPSHNEGVTFEISGLTHSDIEEIRMSCMHMQQHLGEFKQTSYGDILFEQPSRLYVGGLYVCNTKMNYGYNIKPEFLKLERDRQTVDGFDLQLLTKDMWFETKDPDFVADLMEQKIPDLDYADWSTPQVVKEACYRLFKKKYPDAILAASNDELKEMVAEGMTNVVYVGGSFSASVSESASYKERAPILKIKLSAFAELEHYLKINKKYMKRAAIVAFKALLSCSKNWNNK